MKIPVKKNEILEVEILDLTHQGYGVGKVEGFSIFIENTIPQEIVKIRIERIEKRFAFGKLIEIIKASKDRVEVKDILQTRLGTMPLQHMSYDAQLRYKQKQVKDLLDKHLLTNQIEVQKTLGMRDPWEYRNKAQIPVRNIEGILETGFFKRGSHDLVPVETFYIQSKAMDQAILVLRNLLRSLKIDAYDESTQEGIIRHIIVREAHYTKEMMIILVTNQEFLPYSDIIIQSILEKLPNVVSIIQNINTKNTNVILGHKKKVLFGEDKYYDKLANLTFAISSQSFYQVNTIQTEVLYDQAIKMAQINSNDTVIDAYCGIGTISLIAAQKAKHVYGVEVVPDAITMAQYNKKINNINNATFEVGKAEEIMPKWVQDGLKVDVLIVDPPRKGLDTTFIKASVNTKPKRIVYVSCNPVTLARDLKLYQELGYSIEQVQPVDMFPHTTHVETVVLMSRVEK